MIRTRLYCSRFDSTVDDDSIRSRTIHVHVDLARSMYMYVPYSTVARARRVRASRVHVQEKQALL